MKQTRASTFGMLARLFSSLHDPRETDQLLDRIGRDHRKFGVKDAHYEPFFGALLATIEQVSSPAWTEPNSRAWRAVLGYFATSMRSAAAEDAKAQPAWWSGEIGQHGQQGTCQSHRHRRHADAGRGARRPSGASRDGP